MSKGRKSIPNQLKSLRGTDQPVRLKSEVSGELIKSVGAPKELKTRRSKKIYIEKANQLIKMNVLNETDLDQLVVYANSLDLLFQAMDELKKGPFQEVHDENGNIIRFVENPYLKLYRDMISIVNKIASEYGFSPVSRQKLQAQGKDEKKQDIENEIFG